MCFPVMEKLGLQGTTRTETLKGWITSLQIFNYCQLKQEYKQLLLNDSLLASSKYFVWRRSSIKLLGVNVCEYILRERGCIEDCPGIGLEREAELRYFVRM